MKQVQIKARILSNSAVRGNYFKALISAGQIAVQAAPGQFINIKVSEAIEPLLRRPVSIHSVHKDKLGILYEVLGPGTEILSQRKPGELLDVIGPLGNGFSLRTTNDKRQTTILVAGGMGVAPLLFLAETIKGCKFLVLIGARNKSQVFCEKEFKKLGCGVKIATDDGSYGFKGKVTDLLSSILRTAHGIRHTALYACGPRPMLKEVSRLSREYKISAQISLEEHMACGIGACLGCVVNTNNGYQRVCKDGPVFDAKSIIWD